MNENIKKVRLMFDAQFCGHFEKIVDIPINADEQFIKSLFPVHMGLKFDDNCSYEILLS